MQLGHVWICPCKFQTIILRWITTDFKHVPWIRILFICWSRGLFLWMVQRKSRFRNLTRDGTTQEFVSGALRVCKFQSCLLAKYFISANNCSCSHINFGQTGGDLSFGVPYPFQRHWPHGVFHRKIRRSRNLQFLCSLWQLRFFLNLNFSTFKTPPALCCKVLRSFNSALVPLGKRNFKNCLFMYCSRGLFLRMVQRKSRFRNLTRVDGTTQEFVSGTFGLQIRILPTGQILHLGK